jgi:hypothetical protein
VKNCTACSDLILAMVQALIHLVNLSISTNKWVKPRGSFYNIRRGLVPTQQKTM